MDTDYITEMAYQTIVIADLISDYLKVDVAVMSKDYDNENDYLNGVLVFVRDIKNNPEDYLDYWNIHDEIDIISFIRSLEKLEEHIEMVLGTPIEKRGNPPF
ncbi:MAG: hypothetical protein JRK53_15380 [Deltaproteobacteria bacterium]|nr:hypothetical protein [Deltaproteobacteria bacterium]